MRLSTLGDYEFHIPTSGGKAGKGRNVTSTIQVRLGGVVVKHIRFKMDDPAGREQALLKAQAWVKEQ